MSGEGPRPLDDTAPCVGCGLCCNGTLYSRAKAAPGEEPTLLAHGLTLMQADDRTYFQLPCHHESCGRCTIYQERFDVCRSFRCALLRSYHAGTIDGDEAARTVSHALELRRRVVERDPDAATNSARIALRERLARELVQAAPEDRASLADRLLNIVALDTFLDRWFRNKKDASQSIEKPVETVSNS